MKDPIEETESLNVLLSIELPFDKEMVFIEKLIQLCNKKPFDEEQDLLRIKTAKEVLAFSRSLVELLVVEGQKKSLEYQFAKTAVERAKALMENDNTVIQKIFDIRKEMYLSYPLLERMFFNGWSDYNEQ